MHNQQQPLPPHQRLAQENEAKTYQQAVVSSSKRDLTKSLSQMSFSKMQAQYKEQAIMQMNKQKSRQSNIGENKPSLGKAPSLFQSFDLQASTASNLLLNQSNNLSSFSRQVL